MGRSYLRGFAVILIPLRPVVAVLLHTHHGCEDCAKPEVRLVSSHALDDHHDHQYRGDKDVNEPSPRLALTE